MELGQIAPEPSGGSSELGVYRGAFKTSIVWLSAYATKNTPVAFCCIHLGEKLQTLVVNKLFQQL